MPVVAMNGNFQQSQHNKKMDQNDVPLTKGLCYYANEDQYGAYLHGTKGTISDEQASVVT